MKKAANVFAGAVALQVAGGFLNLALLAPTAMQLIHLFLADIVWLSLVRLVLLARRTTSAVVATGAGAISV